MFSVPAGSLEFWRHRLGQASVVTNDIEAHFGEPAIGFNDPSGLSFELIATTRDIARAVDARRSAADAADSRPAQRPDDGQAGAAIG